MFIRMPRTASAVAEFVHRLIQKINRHRLGLNHKTIKLEATNAVCQERSAGDCFLLTPRLIM